MKYAILFRTHYWDSYLEDRLQELKRQAPAADVYICYDATNSDAPRRQDSAPHSVESLNEAGLFTPENRPLWYCGDYPFYDFYLNHPNYEFYLMIENDVYIKGVDIDNVVGKSLEMETDVLGAHFSIFTDPPEAGIFSAGRDGYQIWRKCFFPIVGLKRSALVALFASRLRQADLRRKDPTYKLPFCETFVGSEATKQGFIMTEIGNLARLRTYGANKYVLYEKLSEADDPGIWHSVFPVDKFLDAVVKYDYQTKGANALTDGKVLDALSDVIDHGSLSVGEAIERVMLSTQDKVNRDVFIDRIEQSIAPILAKRNVSAA